MTCQDLFEFHNVFVIIFSIDAYAVLNPAPNLSLCQCFYTLIIEDDYNFFLFAKVFPSFNYAAIHQTDETL